MNEKAKSWIDYRVDAMRYLVGELDDKGCVKNPDFDMAMAASAINALVNLRAQLDGVSPRGYPEAKHAYLNDNDMERLRKI